MNMQLRKPDCVLMRTFEKIFVAFSITTRYWVTALLTLRIALCRPPLPQLVDPNNDVSLPGEKVQICNSVLNATIPMMAGTFELRRESIRLLLIASLSGAHTMLLSF